MALRKNESAMDYYNSNNKISKAEIEIQSLENMARKNESAMDYYINIRQSNISKAEIEIQSLENMTPKRNRNTVSRN
jgi:hypothetical protein